MYSICFNVFIRGNVISTICNAGIDIDLEQSFMTHKQLFIYGYINKSGNLMLTILKKCVNMTKETFPISYSHIRV